MLGKRIYTLGFYAGVVRMRENVTKWWIWFYLFFFYFFARLLFLIELRSRIIVTFKENFQLLQRNVSWINFSTEHDFRSKWIVMNISPVEISPQRNCFVSSNGPQLL